MGLFGPASNCTVQGTFMHRLIRGAAAAALLALAGCAGQAEIPYDKSAEGGIKTVGVLTVDMQEEPSARLASDVGQSFGLIGALVDAGMQSQRDSTLAGIMKSAGFSPRDAFQAALISSLQAHGYAAQIVPVTRPGSGYLKQYPPAGESKVDAYLDITVFDYGFLAAGIGSSTPYRPFIYLHCKLVRASDGAVLMQDGVLYDPIDRVINPREKDVTVSPDPAYVFENSSTMWNTPKKVVAGEDAAFHQTADALAGLLH
jgi:hypothetical protein